MIEKVWLDIQKDGLPQSGRIFLCITRGGISLKLMRYDIEKQRWHNEGTPGMSGKVTHYTKTPEIPSILKMNILLKKAAIDGLCNDEKLELAQLLQKDVV
jgi:hypothetical protein